MSPFILLFLAACLTSYSCIIFLKYGMKSSISFYMTLLLICLFLESYFFLAFHKVFCKFISIPHLKLASASIYYQITLPLNNIFVCNPASSKPVYFSIFRLNYHYKLRPDKSSFISEYPPLCYTPTVFLHVPVYQFLLSQNFQEVICY